jgi:glutamate-1-semialdehyde 2,1-aminomutase
MAGLQGAADAEGVPFCTDSQGGMFGVFLLPQRPQNYTQALKTDSARFNAFFHGLLDRGIYIAPALYEAGFVSAAHTEDDIAATVAAAREVFRLLQK